MAYTALTLVQALCNELGQRSPTTLFPAPDDQASQLLALLNRHGRAMRRQYPWERLVKEGSLTTLAAVSQGAMTTIASDFERFVNDTLYDRAKTWMVRGPLSARAWQADKAFPASSVFDRFRIRGGLMLITPTPAAGRTLYFEYLSKNWAQDADGVTGKEDVDEDDDTFLLDDDLMAMGLRWRFLKANGEDYAEEFREFDMALSQRRVVDGAKPTLYAGNVTPPSINRPGVPEGNW